MYNFNFMYVMKKLLLILFTILLCFNAFSQNSTYTYEKYGSLQANRHTFVCLFACIDYVFELLYNTC